MGAACNISRRHLPFHILGKYTHGMSQKMRGTSMGPGLSIMLQKKRQNREEKKKKSKQEAFQGNVKLARTPFRRTATEAIKH